MDSAAVSEALGAAAEQVLETMFFATAMEEPTEDAGGEPPVRVRLRFQGTPSGTFAIQMAGSAAQSIAADFLGGTPGEFSEAQINQVVCELANMICGATLSRLDEEKQFDLSTPEVAETDSQPPGGGVCRAVYLPDGPLTLCLEFGPGG